jgi:cellulose synthase operon protein C
VSALAGILSTCGAPPLELEVEFAGCDVVRSPASDGVACKMSGASTFDGAARGAPPAGGRRLTLWVKASPSATFWVTLDGKRVEPLHRETLKSGERMEIAVGNGDRDLAVTATRGALSRIFSLPILTEEASGEQTALDKAIACRKRGICDEVDDVAAALTGLTHSGDAAIRARATGQLARFERDRDEDASLRLLREAMDLDSKAGLVSDEVADGLVLAMDVFDKRRNLTEATRVFERVTELSRSFPVGRAMAPRYQAKINLAQGELGAAHGLLDRSEEHALRLGLDGHLADVYQDQIVVLEQLGRHELAEQYVQKLAVLDRLLPDPCPAAQRAANIAWHAILAGRVDGTRSWLEKALDLYSEPTPGTSRCDKVGERQKVLTNLARFSLDTGQIDDAQRYLERARGEEHEAPPRIAGEWGVLDGRLLLARGRPTEARKPLVDARLLGQAAGLPDIEVEAGQRLAEAFEADGQVDEASLEYEKAEDRLNRWSGDVPMGDGKQTFFTRYGGGVRRYLDFLLRQRGRAGADTDRWSRQAVCVARRSRARLVSSTAWSYRSAGLPDTGAVWREREALRRELSQVYKLEAGASRDDKLAGLRARWAKLAGELDLAAARAAGTPPSWRCAEGEAPELAEPADGEVILVYHPIKDGWVGFAVTRAGVLMKPLDVGEAELVEPPEPTKRELWQKQMARALLRPFEEVLGQTGTKKIRIVAAEPLGALDLHELPWGEEPKAPLGSHFSVSYGVDLPRSAPSAAARGARASHRALILVAPSEDLYRAVEEAELVCGKLKAAGWAVMLRSGDDAFPRQLAHHGLARRVVELFHYAGHGFSEGQDGWESRLSLAHGEWLALTDIMTLERAPRVVTLASCQGAAQRRDAEDDYVEGLALAHAFIVAGAEVVVAGTRQSDDYVTFRIVRELYSHHLTSFLDDPPTALQAATSLVRALPEMRGVVMPPLRVVVR